VLLSLFSVSTVSVVAVVGNGPEKQGTEQKPGQPIKSHRSRSYTGAFVLVLGQVLVDGLSQFFVEYDGMTPVSIFWADVNGDAFCRVWSFSNARTIGTDREEN